MSDYQEHENIKYGINKADLRELDKLSLGEIHKYWCKRSFRSKLENIYDLKIFNDINFIHDNKVNNIY